MEKGAEGGEWKHFWEGKFSFMYPIVVLPDTFQNRSKSDLLIIKYLRKITPSTCPLGTKNNISSLFLVQLIT